MIDLIEKRAAFEGAIPLPINCTAVYLKLNMCDNLYGYNMCI